MADVTERVVKVLAERLKLPEAEITNGKEIQADLGADSLDVVDIMLGLEVEFNIQIPDEDAKTIKTVGDVVNYIETHQ